MLRRHRRRGSEQGQILIGVLAMIAFVGVMSVAALNFLDAAFTQHNRTEQTANSNTLAEGAARFAVGTVANSRATQCGGPSTGTSTYVPTGGGTNTTTYSLAFCIPNYVNSSPGINCALCILGTSASALSLNNNANVLVTGEIDVNGGVSMANNATLCSSSGPNVSTCVGTPEFIGIGGTIPADTSAFTPAPAHIAAISDPLANNNTLPAPALGIVSLPQLGSGVAVPGTYQGLSVSSGTATLSGPGVYVFTGDVKISGGARLVANNVTMFFTCSSTIAGITRSAACSAGQHGAGLDLSGNGSYQVSGPTSGTYNNLAVFYDRNNAGDLTGNTGLKISGNGLNDVFSGGIYAASALVDIGGQGNSLFTSNGRLVVNGANIHVGSSTGGLNLVGAALTSTCDLYSASVSSTETVSGTTTTRQGQVVFVSDPNSACGGTRIVSFTYKP